MAHSASLQRNIVYNLSGQVLPVVVAAVCIPVLIRSIGTDRFGLLTIAWTVIGYFSLFDFGLGRSLTWQVSRRLGEGRQAEIPELVRGALILMGCMSLIGSLVLAGLAGEFLRWLKVPQPLTDETRVAFVLLGTSIPLVVLTSGLRGVLEAYQRFDMTNAIRMLQGIWTFVGPLFVLPFSVKLDAMVIVLVVGRLATTIAYGIAAHRVLPAPERKMRMSGLFQKELFSYGGWTTVSNMLSPVMDYMDRFFISSMLGTAIVAFYTTPYELVYRLNFISEGIIGVMFPLMAKRMASSPVRQAGPQMLSLGTKLISASVFPAVLVILLAAHPLLRLWLGPVFELKSSMVLQFLAIGLLVNSLAKVPAGLIQANGRSDVTAKLHLVELPLFIFGLLWTLAHFGIVGAALVWALRMLLDFGLLLWMSGAVAGVPAGIVRKVGALALVQLVPLVVGIVVSGVAWSIAYGAVVLAVFAAVFYRCVLPESERLFLRQSLRRVFSYVARKGVAS